MSTNEKDVAMKAEAKRVNWEHYCGDIPVVSPELLTFWDAVKEKIPDLTVMDGWERIGMYINNTHVFVYSGLRIGHAKQPDSVVGVISYDYHNKKFVVGSRLINNNKYASWNSQSRSKESIHMKKMVKVAQETLLPLQFSEVMEKSDKNIEGAILNIQREINSTIRNAVAYIDKDVWRKELLHMESVGYKPSESVVRSALDIVIKTKEKYDEDANYTPDRIFVWVKADEVDYMMLGEDEIKSVPSIEDLPADIRSKMMILMITDSGRFIRDVGLREGDNRFWVIA